MTTPDIGSLVRNNLSLIWAGFLSLTLMAFSFAIIRGEYWAMAMPAVIVALLLAILRPFWVYFTLLFVLPFSVEYNAGSFSTDLPSEPIALLVAALFAIWAVFYYRSYLKIYLSDSVFRMLALHFSWIVIACIFSAEPLISFKFLVSKTWYLAAFFGMTAVMIRAKPFLVKVFWLIHIPTIISIIIILYRHALHSFSFEEVNSAVSVLYRNHVNYGVFIAMWLPWQIMAAAWYRKGSLARLFIVTSILITLVAVYFSYTRGAWLAVLALPVYYLVVRLRLTKWVLGAIAIAVIVFALTLHKDYAYLKYAPNYETTIYHSDLSEHLGATFSGEDMSTMERFHRWVGAVRMVKDRPITGYGPGNFARYYKPYTVTAFSTYISDNDEMSTVHNYFLLMLTEQGVIGLFIFLIFSAVVFLQGEKAWHGQRETFKQQVVLGLMGCILVFYVNNCFSDLFEANKLAPLFFISLAILVNIRSEIFREGTA